MRLGAACVVAAALVAGCGATTEVREPDLVVSGGSSGREDTVGVGSERGDRPQIAVVTHGEASSTFWSIVRNGIEAGERQMDVAVTYRSPDVYNVNILRRLIEDAIAAKPDGLVVSIPSEELVPAIRRAVDGGVPVVSINSGSDVSLRLGTLAHIGQPEEKAGFKAGLRLVEAGARNVVCVNHEIGNDGLKRRCAGLARALRGVDGESQVVEVDVNDADETRRRLVAAAGRNGVDAVLTLSHAAAELAVEVVPRDVALGTFDFSPAVLAALRSRRILFAVDQQPYLQGYLPIVLLAERVLYGLFPAQGEVIPTGPNFVTPENAAQAERLSRVGIR